MFLQVVAALLAGAVRVPACIPVFEAASRQLDDTHTAALEVWDEEAVAPAFEAQLGRVRDLEVVDCTAHR